MTEPSGSRWFFPVYEGLVEARHQGQMGHAIWLYLYCIKHALVTKDRGRFEYSHVEAASELGVQERTIRRWFCTLQEHGYIEYRARKSHHLEIVVSNWRTIAEWQKSRQQNGERTFLSSQDSERTKIVESTDMRTDIFGPSYIIAYIPIAIYPYGSKNDGQDASIAGVFRGLLEELKKSKNRSATLRQIYKLCFGGDDDTLPDYGYLGKVAKKVGGAERFAQIMWELTTRPPVDPMGYIVKVYGNGGKRNAAHQQDNRRRGNIEKSEKITDELWASAKYADGADG